MNQVYIRLLVIISLTGFTVAGNYSESLAFLNRKLESGSYNTQLRPLMDQNQLMNVSVAFELVSIVEVNDVTQSFICNGFLFVNWKDEILAWKDSGDNVDVLHPLPENIWRPRMILMNTLEDRDLFDDDKAPVFISRDGDVTWVPGSLFPTSCKLNMASYPFDVQTCYIQLVAMTFSAMELQFQAMPEGVLTSYYTVNGEWDIMSKQLVTFNIDTIGAQLAAIKITLVLKRRPTFFLLNVLLPVVFLAFLNIFVFLIPAESGEKISYGITVLLSLSVYMSTVSGMLPRSSLTLPNVIIYLFILLVLSMITVIGSIIIVLLHNMEEKEETQQKIRANFTAAVAKTSLLRQAVSSLSTSNKISNFAPIPHVPNAQSDVISDEVNKEIKNPKVNKYKVIGKHINQICFVIFIIIYIAVTLGFILSIALD
ncbi:acetylcholine receptor subunit delta [Biomphalaria glabrata]|nr:acetylcholine receptor subunit delta [Biomphalaria glabrata]